MRGKECERDERKPMSKLCRVYLFVLLNEWAQYTNYSHLWLSVCVSVNVCVFVSMKGMNSHLKVVMAAWLQFFFLDPSCQHTHTHSEEEVYINNLLSLSRCLQSGAVG